VIGTMDQSLTKRLIIRNVIWIAFMAALLFVPAGTLRWPQAWIYLAELAVSGLVVGLWLARYDPALLEARLGAPVQRGQKVWDKVFMASVFVLWPAWMILMAFDAVRFGWSHVPIWVQVLGAIMIASCMYVAYLTFRENSFAAPVVRVQTERAHRVVSTGPYAYVRHPMYAGALLFIFGTPLLLGSWWGLAAALVIVGIIAGRAVMEERMLMDELDGYREYGERVRYRLFPRVW
jgi:protein-S-isoprenylcysteine O-methyltransferase Ste14